MSECNAETNNSVTELSVKDVHFSQSTISDEFRDGTAVSETIDALKSGDVTYGEDIPTIRVVQDDKGEYVTLDNRRLFALKESLKGKRDQSIQVKVVKQDELSGNQQKHPGQTVADELARKYTTVRSTGIRVKDGLCSYALRHGRNGGGYIYDKQHRRVYVSQLSEKQIKEIEERSPEHGRQIRQARAEAEENNRTVRGDESKSAEEANKPPARPSRTAVTITVTTTSKPKPSRTTVTTTSKPKPSRTAVTTRKPASAPRSSYGYSYNLGDYSGGAVSVSSPGATAVGTYVSSGSANGSPVFQGPRGGVYRETSGGNRVYLKK